MRANDVLEHFLSRAGWVDRERTVDRIIVGDPAAEVARCLVAWMPSYAAVRSAVDEGADVLMCHEPTFWDHLDDRTHDTDAGLAKLAFIEEHGLAVIRNHDCWDRWPAIGIPWAWARFLGLEGEPAVVGADGYQHRYDVPTLEFGEFAGRVAERTASIGAPLVEVVGNLDKPVSRIGIGTGCGCDVFVYLAMDCDCCIVCDDGISYWRHVQYAADQGVPVICVSHGTSEEPGMATLAQYVNEHLEGVAAKHLHQACPFKLVGPGWA